MGSSCCISMLLGLGIFQLLGGVILACAAMAYRILNGYHGGKYHGFMAGGLAIAVGVLAILGSKHGRYWARLVHVAIGCAFIVICSAIVQPLWTMGIWNDRLAKADGNDPKWCFDGCCTGPKCSLAGRTMGDLTRVSEMDKFWTDWDSWSDSEKSDAPCDSPLWMDSCHPNEGALFVGAMGMTLTSFLSLSVVVTVCVAGCMACGLGGGGHDRADRVHANPQTTTIITMSSPWPKQTPPYPQQHQQQQWHDPNNPYNRPANPQPPQMGPPVALFPSDDDGEDKPLAAMPTQRDYVDSTDELDENQHKPPDPAKPAPVQTPGPSALEPFGAQAPFEQ